MTIHPQAIVAPEANIAADVIIGPWSYIGPGVTIGSGNKIGANVIIEGNVEIGKDNEISHFTTIGTSPQHLHYKGENCPVIIGDNNVIREYVSIHRGTEDEAGQQKTVIGNNNFLMVYTHIAHDCQLGSHITMANNATLAGHVTVDDYVGMSGFVAVHQFTAIGKFAFLGRATKVGQGIIPFVTVTGLPGAPVGLNAVGLKRNGYKLKDIRAIKEAYKILFKQNHKLVDALQLLEELQTQSAAITDIIEFIERSRRSIARPEGKVEA